MEKETFVTTIDNPFDYFEDFDNWYKFDFQHGYNTLSYVARLAKTADELSDDENNCEIESAVDSIVRWNPLLYRKVVKGAKKAPVVST